MSAARSVGEIVIECAAQSGKGGQSLAARKLAGFIGHRRIIALPA